MISTPAPAADGSAFAPLVRLHHGDVLDWPAQRAGDALGMSVAAVNSALQRARATLRARLAYGVPARPTTTGEPMIAHRYVVAHHRSDTPGLLAAVRADLASP